MDIYVRNGTPLDGPSLCETCSSALLIRGYRQGEETVMCWAVEPALRVTFRVRECTRYTDKTRQTLYQMEKIAWTLAPRGSKRRAGFLPPGQGDREELETELILDND
jgi:hypothetical protein